MAGGAQALDASDFPNDPAELVALGQSLFADPILSGNGDIACITCHDPQFGLSDGMSLGLGAGATGAGQARSGPNRQRQARNTPALWSLGARQMTVFFWDGRVEADPAAPFGIRSPAGTALPPGLSGPLAGQTLFPMIAPTEMGGRDNPVANAGGPREAWATVLARVQAQDRYRGRVDNIADVANALAAYIAATYRGTGTDYDRFAAGDPDALSPEARRGHDLFFGSAGCAACHPAPLFTDQSFHALGLPQFGPGRARPFDPVARDVGRMGVTDDPADAYHFRTPGLRGVAQSAPYGHNGAWPDLPGMIRQHADPLAARAAWTTEAVILPDAPGLVVPDFAIRSDAAERARVVAAISIEPKALSDADIAALVAFLHALSPP